MAARHRKGSTAFNEPVHFPALCPSEVSCIHRIARSGCLILVNVSCAAGIFGSGVAHFPHNGTQQMNGLLPPIPGPTDQINLNSLPSFNEHTLGSLNGLSTLEPLAEDTAMDNVITSGFEANLKQRRSNSGSQVGLPCSKTNQVLNISPLISYV